MLGRAPCRIGCLPDRARRCLLLVSDDCQEHADQRGQQRVHRRALDRDGGTHLPALPPADDGIDIPKQELLSDDAFDGDQPDRDGEPVLLAAVR